MARDFKLPILEGSTGKLKRWAWMPAAPVKNQTRPYELNNGDSLAFFNLTGQPGRRDILVKDRYNNFWIFNNELKPLWQGATMTGHFPIPFDVDGDGLDEVLIGYSGSPLLPVNWRGDGQEFALMSGNVREGGMINGYLRRVVVFPDDGHPDLAAYATNLTGDTRDEIVIWDQESVWIYTQDRPFSGQHLYAPIRNPTYNESNYRAALSLPHWLN